MGTPIGEMKERIAISVPGNATTNAHGDLVNTSSTVTIWCKVVEKLSNDQESDGVRAKPHRRLTCATRKNTGLKTNSTFTYDSNDYRITAIAHNSRYSMFNAELK